MAHILMLTSAPDAEPLPALGLLSHTVEVVVAAPATLVAAPTTDVIIVDATINLAAAKALCSLLHSSGISCPLFVVVTDGGLSAVNSQWHIDDLFVDGAGPAEVDARIRLAMARREGESSSSKIRASGIVIDEASYSAKARDRSLDLTFKEFELLRFLASHPSHVFTREQLLSEVWGYDYFGGTRTVDVHVRRLRAKLGDMESLIGTVRNVGYCFNIAEEPDKVAAVAAAESSATDGTIATLPTDTVDTEQRSVAARRSIG
jgi:DNA-binding response OmpR family regulator